MEKETLIKFLEFLKTECLRHENDKFISDDEINQLQIEVNSFLQRINKSSFSKELKEEIFKIDFNLDASLFKIKTTL